MKLSPLALILFLLIGAPVRAADAPAPKQTQPSSPVSTNADQPASAQKNDDTAKNDKDASKTPPKSVVVDPKSGETKNGDFKPSEEISEDMAVAYPVDI